MAAISVVESILVNAKARFTKAINSVFKHMGVDGFYQRLGSEKVPVRVVLRQPDPLFELGDRHIVVDQLRLDVRVSDIETPRRNDWLWVDDKHYSIEEEPQLDQHQLVWLLDVLPVSFSGNGESRLKLR